jgi:hypothetical protein
MYTKKVWIFIISLSACPWQAFPAESNACGWGQEPTLEWNTLFYEEGSGVNVIEYFSGVNYVCQ